MRSMGLIGTIYRTIFFELKNLPSKSACARLIRFRLNANGAEFIQEIQFPAQFQPKSNAVLFVHGVDYVDDREAINDFIQPLAEACGLDKSRRHSEFYLLTWNSMLFSQTARDEMGLRNLRRLLFYAAAFLWWGLIWRDAERRAGDAAATLAEFLEAAFGTGYPIGSVKGFAPTAVTHSAGALVWAKAIKLLSERRPDLIHQGINIGRWWNLQPALPASAFCGQGDYAAVAALYDGARPNHLVWFSRMDFILGGFYRLARRAPAMGQFGSSNRLIRQRDVTWMTMEAHGNNVLMRLSGSFFARARRALRVDARALGLV